MPCGHIQKPEYYIMQPAAEITTADCHPVSISKNNSHRNFNFPIHEQKISLRTVTHFLAYLFFFDKVDGLPGIEDTPSSAIYLF